jgi:hypothetical protein
MWRRESTWLATVQQMVLLPSYQRIIGMGPAVVPLLLGELKARPAHWFWALNAITREDPAAGIDRFSDAREAWLSWGRDRGYPV